MLISVRAALPPHPQADLEGLQLHHQAATEMLGQLRPTKAIEAMLAAHTVAAHHLAMDVMRRASDTDLPDDQVLKLCKGAKSMARLSVDALLVLRRQQSRNHGRVQMPDVPARTVQAAAEQPAPAQPLAPLSVKTAKDPMHQSATPKAEGMAPPGPDTALPPKAPQQIANRARKPMHQPA